MKPIKPISLIVAAATIAAPAFAQDIRQADNAWFTAGQERIQAELSKEINTGTARNVILMISDGNGVGTN